MTPKPVLLRKLNARNIVLYDREMPEHILIKLKDQDEYRAVRWLGFLDSETARYLWKGRPVKLKAERFGYEGDFSTDWAEIKSGHVMECVCPQGAFGVLQNGHAVASRPSDESASSRH